jgi:hypothetical protein
MRRSLLCAVMLAGLWLLLSPAQAQAQYAYGYSEVGYNSRTREVFGYSETFLDYYAGYYYDPEVLAELYWQFENEIPLDRGYGVGYANYVPAQAWTHSTLYRQLTTYEQYSVHFIRAYYYYNPCYSYGFMSPCYSDPYGFDFFSGGGVYGGYYGFPNYFYDAYYYAFSRRIRVGVLRVFITTPADDPCFTTGASFDAAGTPCVSPTPPPPPPQGLTLEIITTGTGVPLAQGSPPRGGLPYVRSLTVRAVGTPSGGTYSWSTTSNKVRLSNADRANVTVTSVSKSDQTGDVRLNVVYKVNGSEISGHIDLTVQQPTAMRFIRVNYNRRNDRCSTAGDPEYLAGSSGWEKEIQWQVVDHLGNAMSGAELPITSTMNVYAGQGAARFRGMTAQDRYVTYNNGYWAHRYHWCSTRCGRGEPDVVRGFQRYVVNGFQLRDIRFAFECNRITIEGDGSDQRPLRPRSRRVAQFVQDFWMESLWVDTDDSERQYWTDRLINAQAQGQAQLLAEAQAFGRSLMQSTDYINRDRSDENFVYDLYRVYLQRDPDEGGFNFWLGVLQSDNAQGMNGREHLLQAFEQSAEFANLVYALEPGYPPPYCDLVQEQDCYNQGGAWDPGICQCELPPPPDPCWNGSYYICE